MTATKEDIKKLIDNDEGLRSKRRMLTIISLILLGVEFSGAKVVEANTFILKLSFEHQKGIAILLLLAILFLLIRYYNYARLYHEKLYELWSSRMLGEQLFSSYCEHSDELSGLVFDFLPKGLDVEKIRHDGRCHWGYGYRCSWFFRRYIRYDWSDENPECSESVSLFGNVSFFTYLKILGYELKYRVTGFITHREHLDIMAPYVLGVFAMTSYFCSEKVIVLIDILS